MSAPADPVLLVAGPTASGKTALAIAAARHFDGEIINADSMQLYDGLRLLTARPSAEEEAAAPHHLFGAIDPGLRYSTGAWAREAMRLIDEIRGRGRRPILVGGTGLYFAALTKGLADMPEVDEASRARAEAVEASGLEALRAEAERFDPQAAARILGEDRQRLRRVVEIGYATGRPISAFQAETRPLLAEGDWRGFALIPDREALYERIDRRFDQMMDEGALAEAEAFAARGLDADLPAMKALGLPPLMAHLRGETALDEAVEIAKRDSRRYAKRQLTWLRNQTPDWPRLTSFDPQDNLAAMIEALSP